MLESGRYTIYVPKDTLITSPALFYAYNNEYYTGGDDFVEENGFAVSNVAGSGFGELITVISPAYWDIDPIKNLIYFIPFDEGNDGDNDIAPIILSYSFLDGVIDTVYNHTNQTGFGFVALDYIKENLYFLEEQDEVNAKIMRLNLTSLASPELFISNVLLDNGSDQSDDNDPTISIDLDLLNQRIYWHQASNTGALSTVMRKNLDGSGEAEIVLEDKPIYGEIVVDAANDLLFTVNAVPNQIESLDFTLITYDLDTKEAQTFDLGEDFQGAFAIHPSKQEVLYTSANYNENNTRLYSTSYNGENVQELTPLNVTAIRSLAVLQEPNLLESDKAALLDLLANTTGFTPTNWSADNELDNTWQGVTIENDRVVKLELKGTALNRWKGEIPESLLNLTGLIIIDLSGHELKSFPNASRLPNLTQLNISDNRLGFQHIIPNISIGNVTYAPQKRYGEVRYDTLAAGKDALLSVDVMGANASYEWKFAPLRPGRPFNDSTVQTVGNTRLLPINSVNFDSQGTYRVFIKNTDAPLLTLESRNQNIMAKTNIFGNITKGGAPMTAGGEVFIYRQTPRGPFIKEDSSIITSNGKYGIRDVVLGNFVIQVKPDRTTDKKIIQTYYISAETYKLADTLKLRDEIDGINIGILDYTPRNLNTDGARIRGQLFSDVEDEVVAEDGSRVLARRKVRKAACSMRKFKSTGRDLQDDVETEIAYYIETDDDGYFDFTGVESGKYLLNIEFPGVPMDPTSEVEFEISEDKDNQVFDVLAIVGENGINIDQTEVLFSWKPYLKEINIYPNPTEGIVTFDYLVYRNIQDLKVQVVSMQGALLKEEKLIPRLGKHNAKIDLTEYKAGIYFMVFTNEAGVFKQEIKLTKK